MSLPAMSLSAASAPDAPFIICDNLVKIYQVAGLELVALQGLDLVVAAGELLGVIGSSGSGKSTLMNVLGGLDRPSAGRAWVNGQDLLKLTPAELGEYRRTQVGFVWQQGERNLIPYLSALDNVKLPLTLTGQAGREAHTRAAVLLDLVGLGQRMKHRLAQLSGGEQQRVAIAVALANQPRLLLADEPTGELDTETALAIYALFQKLNRELGLTTLIVSHDPTIARHVQRVVAIRDGKLASETVRADATTTADAAQEVFHELAVVDTAGRIQIPRDYLERFSIHGRARLEATDDGILIRPAVGAELQHVQSAEALATELEESQKARGIGGMLRRWMRGESKGSQ